MFMFVEKAIEAQKVTLFLFKKYIFLTITMSSFEELEGTLNEKFSPFPRFALEVVFPFISSVRSSYSHPDLLVTQQHPTFSDHTGPQHWTFTF